MTFCLDTSAFLDAWERWYPQDVFPGVWEEMDTLIELGTVVAPEDVLHEMQKKSDGVYQWAKTHRERFLPLADEIQISLRTIMGTFPDNFVDPRKGRSGADPIVVATAMAGGHTVVTGERPSGNRKKPKIPDVCQHYNIRCCNFMEMLRELEMSFRSSGR